MLETVQILETEKVSLEAQLRTVQDELIRTVIQPFCCHSSTFRTMKMLYSTD